MTDADDVRARAQRILSVGLHPYATATDGLPVLARTGEGAHFVDSDGRRHLDWNMAWGSLLLGYRHPEVEAAVREQLDRGSLFSVPHELEVEVAERLVELIPCAEKVAFGKNGSDVCAAAVRIARAVTGREGILQFGYHGFHDWCAILNPEARGVPDALRPLIYPLPYNDLDGLRAILADHGHRIAAVIMEPMRDEFPAPGFLEGVREAMHANGSLLIFDEMVTGFRLATGGAQDAFDVMPDLACFGKALANGLPLSALVGRADLMDVARTIAYGMTTRGETLALAAARATLTVHARDSTAESVLRIGNALRDGFAAVCARRGIDATLVGHPAMQGFALPDGLEPHFLAACRERGIFTNGHLLPSIAHDDESIQTTCEVFDAALAVCEHAS